MAYEEITNRAMRLHVTEMIEIPFEGYYIGSRSKSSDLGDYLIHDFISKANGNKVSIFGFTAFNSLIVQIPEGVLCKLTYLGTENVKTKYGHRDVHQIHIMADRTQVYNPFETDAPIHQLQDPLSSV